MNDSTPQKEEYIKIITTQLSNMVINFLTIYLRLLKITDPKTQTVDCPLNYLAQRFCLNRYVLAAILSEMAKFKLINFPKPQDFKEKVKVNVFIH